MTRRAREISLQICFVPIPDEQVVAWRANLLLLIQFMAAHCDVPGGALVGSCNVGRELIYECDCAGGDCGPG